MAFRLFGKGLFRSLIECLSGWDENPAEIGQRFEGWVVNHFDRRYYTLNEWRGDKYINGRYAESSLKPDLELTLHRREGDYRLAVECKFRGKMYDGLQISNPSQLKRYKDFAQQSGIPVYIVLGIGYNPAWPQEVYIVPLEDMTTGVVNVYDMLKYKRPHAGSNFFYSPVYHTLT